MAMFKYLTKEKDLYPSGDEFEKARELVEEIYSTDEGSANLPLRLKEGIIQHFLLNNV